MISRIYSIEGVSAETRFSDDIPNVAELHVKAFGQVNSGGWSSPELGPWMYIHPPEDGVLSIDFFASPPPPGLIVTMAFQPIRAEVTFPVPDWVRRVQVHAATNSVGAEIKGPMTVAKSDGSSVPWPWPWYRTHVV